MFTLVRKTPPIGLLSSDSCIITTRVLVGDFVAKEDFGVN